MSGHNVGSHEAEAEAVARRKCRAEHEVYVTEGWTGVEYLEIVMSRHDARPN